MGNLQDILNQFSQSKVASAGGTILYLKSRIKPIYEFDTNGNVIQIHESCTKLRKEGIEVHTSRTTLTRTGRIFHYEPTIPKFDEWYKKRKWTVSSSVLQYTPDGQFVKKYKSIKELKEVFGNHINTNLVRYFKDGPIRKDGKRRLVRGFYWEKE